MDGVSGDLSIGTAYGRRLPTLSAWCAVAFVTPLGLDEVGGVVEQRESIKRLLVDQPKGGYFRNEVARHIMAIRALEAERPWT
jgi:hypothetical protein